MPNNNIDPNVPSEHRKGIVLYGDGGCPDNGNATSMYGSFKLYKDGVNMPVSFGQIRTYPSKTCSSCGVLFEGLSLADRWVECSCGLSVDRDVNAALNILWVGQTHWGKSTDNGLRLPQEAPPL